MGKTSLAENRDGSPVQNTASQAIHTQFHDEIARLRALVRKVSLTTLRDACGISEARDADVEDPAEFMFGYWMSLIFIAGNSFRLTFKTHYTVTGMRGLVARTMGAAPSAVNESIAHDFFREFSNLVAGSCRANLDCIALPTGLSLPLITRGFDEIYYRRRKKSHLITDDWRLLTGDGNLTCSLITDVFEWQDLEKLTNLPENGHSFGGEVELL